jgi:hypothetical protein
MHVSWIVKHGRLSELLSKAGDFLARSLQEAKPGRASGTGKFPGPDVEPRVGC